MEFPEGFRITGLKDESTGFGLITAPCGMSTAGIFTRNTVASEPVKYCRTVIERESHRAVLVNRGSANAATGSEGRRRMFGLLDSASSALGVEREEILHASTGVIGMQLEYSESTLNRLFSKKDEVDPCGFAEAIMTTDTVSKTAWSSFKLGGRKITLYGAAKGAGMICPDMATMLAFIMTDADIEKKALDKALRESAALSFNALCVDGETSTSDSVFLCASGKAGNRSIGDSGSAYGSFLTHLERVCLSLTEKIAADGEGATKMIKVTVKGAPDTDCARTAARAVAASPLCKTAFYGASPNWGRIISALGASGIHVNLESFSVYVNGAALVRNGARDPATAEKAREVMSGGRYNLEIDLGLGREEASFYTCDLSPEYVRINAHYIS